jgi:hypothetical protein
MKTTKIFIQLFVFIFINSAIGFCNTTLIKSEFYKDGGTRCVEYEKAGNVIKCCIDGRPVGEHLPGTNEVFFGGYPSHEKSRVITREEMKAVYDDVSEIMNSSEYKKYSAMTRDEMKALIVINNQGLDEEKLKEHRKATSYRSLRPFKDELLKRLQKHQNK